MTRIIVLVGFSALCLGTSASAQDRPPVIARAETCLRANVDRVVEVERDLHSAATFLVSFTCAETTAAAARHERNVALLNSFKALSGSLPKDFAKSTLSVEVEATVDPETGEFVIPPPKVGERPSPMTAMLPQMSANAGMMLPEAAPTGLRQLAGELVLAARERKRPR